MARGPLPCRHCDELPEEHRILTDRDGCRYLVCPASLEDNTYGPELPPNRRDTR